MLGLYFQSADLGGYLKRGRVPKVGLRVRLKIILGLGPRYLVAGRPGFFGAKGDRVTRGRTDFHRSTRSLQNASAKRHQNPKGVGERGRARETARAYVFACFRRKTHRVPGAPVGSRGRKPFSARPRALRNVSVPNRFRGGAGAVLRERQCPRFGTTMVISVRFRLSDVAATEE